MGTMRERSPGRWELRVFAGSDERGKPRQVSRTHYGGVRSAKRALAELEAEVARGKVVSAPRQTAMTIERLAKLHIKERRAEWSPNTLRDREGIARRHLIPKLGDRNINKLTTLEVERFVNGMAAEHPPTARNCLAMLRAMYSDADRWGLLLGRNPARAARPPKVEARAKQAPDLGDVQLVIESLLAGDEPDTAFATMVRLAVVTGARRGEIAALRWSDVDFDSGVVTIERSIVVVGRQWEVKSTKTNNTKRLPLDAGTMETLRAFRLESRRVAMEFGVAWDEDRWVWSRRPDGAEPWGLGTITHRWRTVADECGLTGVRWHDLRHAMVSQLIAAGFDPSAVAERAGHASTTMTLNVYAHALPVQGQAAADHLGRLLDG